MRLCGEDCCIGSPIQQLVVERSSITAPCEIHLFSDGMTEVDFTLRPDDPEVDFTTHFADVHHSLGAALDWIKANQHRLIVDDRIDWIDGSGGMFTEEQYNAGLTTLCQLY